MARPWKIIDESAEPSVTKKNSDLDVDQLLEEKRTNARKATSSEQDSLEERMAMFMAETPIRSMTHLVVADVTRQQINTLLAKVIHHEFLYETWDLKSIDPYGRHTAINLYGPPGTGKSLCAEAIAHHLQKQIIRVNYAEIESKYVGDTPKNIRAAFFKARVTGAVLFFDEADSILGRRLTNVTQSADHGVNVSRSVMLMELDHFDGITVFASNLPSNYDPAFVRRIIGHIEMPLPDKTTRALLWEMHIPKRMKTSLNPSTDFEVLATASETLSGGDILNAVLAAAATAVQREEPTKCVNLSDLLTAIENGRKAKQNVANPGGPNYLFTETIPAEKAPADVQNRLSKLASEQLSPYNDTDTVA